MSKRAKSVDGFFDSDLDDESFLLVYRELRNIARSVRRRNPQKTINTTSLVHEAWLRLNARHDPFNERSHYLCTAARAMRQVLVDYARYRGAARRNREEEVPLLDGGLADTSVQSVDEILALEQALDALERLDARCARLVMLRFYAGLSGREAAEVLGVSPRSAARDWTRAQAFLKSRLQS